MAKVQEIANYIRGKLKTEKKVSLNELGERFPMPSEGFDAVSRLVRAEGCIEVAIPGGSLDREALRWCGSVAASPAIREKILQVGAKMIGRAS